MNAPTGSYARASRVMVCLSILVASLSPRSAFAQSRDAAAAEGEHQTATVSPDAAAPVVKKDADSDALNKQGKIGLTIFAVSGATFVAGVVTGGLVLAYDRVIDDHCDPISNECDDEGREASDVRAGLSTASTVTYIVGGVGMALGSALLLTRNLGKANKAPVSAGFVVMPGHASVVLSGRF